MEKRDPDLERRLRIAWDFLEHWELRLSAKDGEKRLGEFYSAMFKFLKRESTLDFYLDKET